jgi:hypothetical protein
MPSTLDPNSTPGSQTYPGATTPVANMAMQRNPLLTMGLGQMGVKGLPSFSSMFQPSNPSGSSMAGNGSASALNGGPPSSFGAAPVPTTNAPTPQPGGNLAPAPAAGGGGGLLSSITGGLKGL